MRECVERWLTFWAAKPISWAIFAVWIAIKCTWFGGAWSARKARDKWTAWRNKSAINGAPVVCTQPPIPVTSKRGSKRQAA
jgi:hypothetical protein